MTTLDHLYGAGQTSQSITALENKVNNLSQITVKNNISDQRIPQQRISVGPTNEEHIIRLHDTQYVRIVNQTSSLNNPNTVWQFTPASELKNQRIHSFIIKAAISGVDYIFNWSGWIQDRNYKNMGPTFSFASGDNFNETAKIKVWIHDNKFKMLSNISIANCSVYMKVENHR